MDKVHFSAGTTLATSLLALALTLNVTTTQAFC